MKFNLILAAVFLSVIIYANIDEMHGIVGLTKKDGGIGCLCHDLDPTDSVFVWIEGPDSVLKNSSTSFRLMMTGGPAVAGGFNIASYFGEVDSVDSLTKVLFGELTHTSPNPFNNDTVFWNFLYNAPDSLLTDTIYSVANSVNWDSIPSNLDQWNFGENFVIYVVDNPTSIQNDIISPQDFVLYQNYPNPFNPTTNIGFRVADIGLVSLIIYDALGNEVINLIQKELPAGEYKIEFNASGLTSGIYYYRLTANNFIQTRKMILLK